jgi:hypothetical protein
MFLWAGFSKATALEVQAVYIEGYRIIPEGWADAAALCLVVWEIIIGAGLIVFGNRPLVHWTALATLGVFVVAQSTLIVRGIATPCGCFSATEYVSARTLARTGLLFLVSGGLAVGTTRLSRSPRTAAVRARVNSARNDTLVNRQHGQERVQPVRRQ